MNKAVVKMHPRFGVALETECIVYKFVSGVPNADLSQMTLSNKRLGRTPKCKQGAITKTFGK